MCGRAPSLTIFVLEVQPSRMDGPSVAVFSSPSKTSVTTAGLRHACMVSPAAACRSGGGRFGNSLPRGNCGRTPEWDTGRIRHEGYDRTVTVFLYLTWFEYWPEGCGQTVADCFQVDSEIRLPQSDRREVVSSGYDPDTAQRDTTWYNQRPMDSSVLHVFGHSTVTEGQTVRCSFSTFRAKRWSRQPGSGMRA